MSNGNGLWPSRFQPTTYGQEMGLHSAISGNGTTQRYKIGMSGSTYIYFEKTDSSGTITAFVTGEDTGYLNGSYMLF